MSWNRGHAIDHTIDMIEPFMFGTVLDIGCGTGRISSELARRHPDWTVIGYDPDPSDFPAERLSNEQYVTRWPRQLDSAFALLVLQHLPDEEAGSIIKRVYPRPFRFQYVVGTIRHHLNYQRSQGELETLCRAAGYETATRADPVYDEWRWVTAA